MELKVVSVLCGDLPDLVRTFGADQFEEACVAWYEGLARMKRSQCPHVLSVSMYLRARDGFWEFVRRVSSTIPHPAKEKALCLTR